MYCLLIPNGTYWQSVDKQAQHGSMDHFVTHKGIHTHTHTYTSSDLWYDPEPCLLEQSRDGREDWNAWREESKKDRRGSSRRCGSLLWFLFIYYTLSFSLSLWRLCAICYRPRNPYHWPTARPSFVVALSISLPTGQYRPVPWERHRKKEVWRPLDVLCFLNWCAGPLHFYCIRLQKHAVLVIHCKSNVWIYYYGFLQFRVILKSLKLENN